jgi:putative phosphoribosyl transferase
MSKPSMTNERSLMIDAGSVELAGDLGMPAGARALVLFAHGSGSSRKSARNRLVARALWRRGLATLLFDLLTAEEAERDAIDASWRFDIPRLAERLAATTEWARRQPATRALPLGYFGASTGAAAALLAAAERPADVGAVVSRGGRPDLARGALERVLAPTLLIVGGEDTVVLALNRAALEPIPAEKQLSVVPGATHLFEEPGALDEVAQLAGAWFARHLIGVGRSRPVPAFGG